LTLTVAYAGDRLNVAFLKGRQGPEILQINLNLKHCKDMIDLGRHLFSDSIERNHLFKHNLVVSSGNNRGHKLEQKPEAV
jgi:hypothetical protein